MNILGIESSCDETAAAVVRDGTVVISDVVSSQIPLHRLYGGIVPEIASRAHLTQIVPVVAEALMRAQLSLAEIDALAVTCGPGLVGSLLVGVQMAKAMAYACGLPLIGVNHLEGHLAAVYLRDPGENSEPRLGYPHLGLLVSGGHTALIFCREEGQFELLGSTRDDAAGEAFDKVAKLLGLGYPGGVVIDRLAAQGNPRAIAFPRSMLGRGLDFSFSGIKTAVALHVRQNGIPTGAALADLCASFQRVVVEQLVRKALAALDKLHLKDLQVAGGVAANAGLRATLEREAKAHGFRLWIPPIQRCTDHAAMIAAAGYRHLIRGERSDFSLNASSSLSL